ncbi:CDP-alcohol phosphatidyltransferase family protein [bacterium]|nr:CDP-alcohol phosphatidyltransferase family protein [bacterium]
MNRNTATWFTLGNVGSGLISLLLFRRKKSGAAVVAMVVAGILDVLDGWAARKSGTVGRRGSELDSTADMTSFGLVPAFMLLSLNKAKSYRFVSWLYPGSILFRLFRFATGGGGPGWFTGMPSPATAIAVTGSCALAQKHKYLAWLPPVTAAAFSSLAVCKLPYGKLTHPSLGLLSRPLTYLIWGVHIVLFFLSPGLAALSLMVVYAFLGPSLMHKFHRLQEDSDRPGE